MHLTGWFVQRARSGMHSDMRWPRRYDGSDRRTLIRRERESNSGADLGCSLRPPCTQCPV